MDQFSTHKRRVLQAIDEWEKIVINSSSVLGRVVVNQMDYLKQLENLKALVLQLEKERR